MLSHGILKLIRAASAMRRLLMTLDLDLKNVVTDRLEALTTILERIRTHLQVTTTNAGAADHEVLDGLSRSLHKINGHLAQMVELLRGQLCLRFQ